MMRAVMTIMRKFLRPLSAGLILFCLAAPVSAQDDDEARPDARLEGYVVEGKIQAVALPPSGTAGTWAIFVVLSVLCIGVMFKSGKRTHLDTQHAQHDEDRPRARRARRR